MDEELEKVDSQMKIELAQVKAKYSEMKKEIKKKYKKLEAKKPKEKKPRESIPKTLKSSVWDKSIGKANGIGKCECCSKEIDSKNFECGHIKSVKDGGGTDIENLKPLCSECNKSMGTENLYEFKEKYFKEKPKEEIKEEYQIFHEKSRNYNYFGKYYNSEGYEVDGNGDLKFPLKGKDTTSPMNDFTYRQYIDNREFFNRAKMLQPKCMLQQIYKKVREENLRNR